MTTEANPTLGKVEQIFKKIVWDTLVDVGITALFAEAPVLAAWPIGPVIRYILKMFGDKFFAVLKLNVDLAAIKIVNEANEKDFDKAAVALKIIARNYGIESDEFRKAKDEAREALSKLVRYHGT